MYAQQNEAVDRLVGLVVPGTLLVLFVPALRLVAASAWGKGDNPLQHWPK